MSRLESLKSTKTRRGLAKLLQFKPSALPYILFKQLTANKYKTFTIPKRKGGTRTIKAPTDRLKLMQQRLSDLLQDCAAEINEAKKRKDRIAHGFKRARSIVTAQGNTDTVATFLILTWRISFLQSISAVYVDTSSGTPVSRCIKM
jgi:RNA-directed DNA polymerase